MTAGFVVEPGADAGPPLGRFPALSALAGVAHGVTTAAGPPFAAEAEGPATAAAARQTAARLGLEGVAWARQVHGGRVMVAAAAGLLGEADGLVTARRGLGVLVRGADCPLILLADAGAPPRAVGVAHASWRSTLAGIAGAVVRALADLGADPARLVAGIAPGAGPCCYEVGPEVEAAAREALGPGAAGLFERRGGRLHLDLWRANRRQLLEAGLRPQNIHLSGICTICDPRFPSHRRERGLAARFGAVIGLASPALPPGAPAGERERP